MPTTRPAAEGLPKRRSIALGAVVPFGSLDDSGTYVCNWSGHLMRVPGDGLDSVRRSSLNMVGSGPLLVTKISHNPYVAVPQARDLARQYCLNVNF